MITSRTKIIAGSSALLVAVALGGLYAAMVYTAKSPGAGLLEGRYVADFSGDRKVIGAAQNVFVAKITKLVEHTYMGGVFPVTVYEAEVIHNIKGNLEGTVPVIQLAGYVETEEGPVPTSFSGRDVRLLQPGEVYLLATDYEEEHVKPWSYVINDHPNGSHLLSSDGSLDKAALGRLTASHAKVKAWEKAYQNEILP